MNDEDKDRELAVRLFGVSEKRQDAWPFEVPHFTSNAQACRQAIEAIVNSDGPLAGVFDRRAKEYLDAIGWVSGWSMGLLILTPSALVDIMLDSLGEVGR